MRSEAVRLAAYTVGIRLKTARDKRGLTLKTVAESAGVSIATVAQIENGNVQPRIDTVEKLAVSLRVTRCWLAYGDGEKPDW